MKTKAELTKSKLRSKILTVLRKQKEEDRQNKSKKIKKKLFSLVEFKKAKRVMFYIAQDAEVETKEMIQDAQRQGKIVAVPVCERNKKKIIPCKIGLKEKFKKGSYGIKEPLIKRPLAIKDIDLVIVPGVAYDLRGHRLGRGGGYYDSLLRTLPAKTISIGLAFEVQISTHLPVTKNDVAVDEVLFA